MALGVLDRDLAPLAGRVVGQHLLGDPHVGLHALWAAGPGLIDQEVLQAPVEAALEDRLLVVAVLGQTLDLGLLDGQRALVLLDAAARENPDLDHGTRDPRGHPKRGVAHVRGLLAEDRAQKLLLRGHRRFALGGHLADQDVAGADLGADIDDARFVEVVQRVLADVRDVPGDLLLAEFCVARHDLELLDMDRGEDVVAHDALGDQDGVLEVVALPRHEGDQDVATQRQLAQVRGRAVGDDVAALDLVADPDQRPLVDAGVLVRALELQQVIDVDGLLAARGFLGDPDHDAGRVDLIDHARALGRDGHARIARHRLLHAGADQGRLGLKQRHRLALHVGAHERAVGVVVLEERDERRGDRHQLLG